MSLVLQFALLILTGFSWPSLPHLSSFQEFSAGEYLHVPQTSPDGKWIAITKVERFAHPEPHTVAYEAVALYLQNVKTRQIKRLLWAKSEDNVLVTAGWSPDSRRILFWSLNYSSRTANTDGSALRDVSINGGKSRYFGLVRRHRDSYKFSPDGHWLCVVEGNSLDLVYDKRIAVYDYRTGAKHWVSAPKMASIDPAWSPDSNYLAFIATTDAHPRIDDDPIIETRGREFHLWTVRRDGSGKIQLTHDPNYFELFPKWSQNRQVLRFMRVLESDSRSFWEIGINGTGLHKLEDEDSKRTFMPRNGGRN